MQSHRGLYEHGLNAFHPLNLLTNTKIHFAKDGIESL